MSDVVDSGAEAAHEDDASQAHDDSLEAIARSAGWKPKEEFDRPDNWVDAPTYLRGTSGKLKQAREAAEAARRELKRVGAATDRMVSESRREALEQAQRDFELARETGDVDAGAEAARRMERAKAPQPEVQAWVSKNASWFNADPAAQMLAQGVAERQARAGSSVAEQLEAAEAEVRRVYPSYFPDAPKVEPRKAPPATQGGARVTETIRSGPKGFADLPADAKRAYHAAVDKVGPAKREDFGKRWTKSYWEANS